MSLRHMDFPSGQTGLYGTNASLMLNGLYANASGDQSIIEDPDPNVTGNVVQIFRGGANGRNTPMRFVLPSGQATAGIGVRLWLPSLPTNSAHPHPLRFMDNTNTEIASLGVETTGALTVNYAGGSFTSNALAVVANAWQHVEMKIFVSATVGTIEVRVEGIPVINLTGLNTGTALVAQVGHATQNNGSTLQQPDRYYLKDIIYWDGAGSVNNNFFGSVAVYELIPDGDVIFPWAASNGGATGYNLIDESPPNDNTDYIYALNPPPAACKFTLTDLPIDVTSVRALYTVVRSLKTDGGDGNLQVGLVSGASTGLGSDRPVTTAYTYWADMFELDPATSTAWTRISANAAQLQLNRTL